MYIRVLKRFSNNAEDTLEVKRQFFHLVLISLWCVPIYFFPFWWTVLIFLAVIVINSLLTLKLEPFHKLFSPLIEHLERERNMSRPGLQALYANLGIFLSFLLFGKLSLVGVVVLAVGDSLSTLVGRLFGREKLFYNEEKSWEGSLAFLISTYLVLVWFISPRESLLIATAGALFESLKLGVDDNLTLPLLATSVAYLV